MLVIFDCDGVLIDSEVIFCAVDSEALARLGHAMTPSEFARRFCGTPHHVAWSTLSAELGFAIPDQLIEEVRAECARRFETELKGYVTDQWQSWLGYAYTDARITSNTSTTIVAGNRVQLVPFHQFSWWNKYQIDPTWAVSFGVLYFSDSFASSDDSVRLPGYVRFDGGVFAKIDEHWKAQLNIENIFNKGYWASADGNNNISPGQPRTIRLKATATF